MVTGLVKDRLLGCMGRFYSRVSGKDRNQGWDKGDGIKVSCDKELTEVVRMAGGD